MVASVRTTRRLHVVLSLITEKTLAALLAPTTCAAALAAKVAGASAAVGIVFVGDQDLAGWVVGRVSVAGWGYCSSVISL